MSETLTKEMDGALSKLHIGTNGMLQLPRQKSKAIELIRQTQAAIANLSATVEKARAEAKSIKKQISQTRVGMRLKEVEEISKKAKRDHKSLTERYAGMIEAFAELGIDIDFKQIKMIKEG